MVVRRRSRAVGGRPVTVMVALSQAEAELVRAAAGKQNMALGAWVGDLAVRTAETGVPEFRTHGGLSALAPMYSELMEHRRVLRNVGGNLNDIARHANTTGTLPQATERVQRLVARVVERIELAVDQVEQLARETRTERARRGRRRRALGLPLAAMPVPAADVTDQSEWEGQ